MDSNIFDEKIAEFDAKHKLSKYRMIVTAEEANSEQAKLKPIYDEFSDDNTRYIQEIVNIADKYQIVRVKHKRKEQRSEILYHVYIGLRRTNVCTYSFESALIEAIAQERQCGQAALWINRMLGIKDIPEFED